MAGVVCGGYWCWLKAKAAGWGPLRSTSGWGVASVISILALGLAVRTWVRNEDYRSEETIWSSVLADHPTNVRANHNLAMKLTREGRSDEAIANLKQAIEACHQQQRTDVDLQVLLGEILTREGNFAEALSHLNNALENLPAVPWSESRRKRRHAECLLTQTVNWMEL